MLLPAYPRIAARGAVTGGGAEVTEAQSQLRPGPGQLVSPGPGGCTPPRRTQVLKQPSPSSCPSGLTHPEHVPSRPPPRARGQPLSVHPRAAAGPGAGSRTQNSGPRTRTGPATGSDLHFRRTSTARSPPGRHPSPTCPVGSPVPWEGRTHSSTSTPGHTSIFVAWPLLVVTHPGASHGHPHTSC